MKFEYRKSKEGFFKAVPLFKASLPSLLILHYQINKRWLIHMVMLKVPICCDSWLQDLLRHVIEHFHFAP